MKNNFILGIFVLLLLSVTAATAAIEITETSVTVDADYSNFNDEDQNTISGTVSAFTLKNTDTLADAVVTVSVSGFPSSKYSAEARDYTITAGSTLSVTDFKINIPQTQDQDETEIGALEVKLKNGTSVEDSAKLIQNTLPMLLWEELKVEYSDKDEKTQRDYFEDDKLDVDLEHEVLPDSEIIFTFKLKNLFDDDYDEDYSELEDIQITIEPDDDDVVRDDFEEDYELENLRAGEKISQEIRFFISEEADSQDYSFEITIEAEDGKGNKYSQEKTLTIEVERQSDHLKITRAELGAEEITTCDTSFTLDFEVKNIGTQDQRYAGISIYNSELTINENIRDLNIERYDDDENTWSRKFTFTSEKGFAPGTHVFDLRAYVDRTVEMDRQQVTLIVEEAACGVTVPPTEDEEEPTPSETEQTQTTTGTTTGNQISSSVVAQTVENPYTSDDLIIAGLIVAVILVLAMIVTFFVILVK